MSQEIASSNNNIDRDIGLVRQQAVQVAESATQITVTANEVAEGAETQLRVLDSTVAIANEMTASIGEARLVMRLGTSSPGRSSTRGITRMPGNASSSLRSSGVQMIVGSSMRRSVGWMGQRSG